LTIVKRVVTNADAGQEALGADQPAAAASRFADALALWRSPPLADVAGVELLGREAARLEELHDLHLTDRLAGAAPG